MSKSSLWWEISKVSNDFANSDHKMLYLLYWDWLSVWAALQPALHWVSYHSFQSLDSTTGSRESNTEFREIYSQNDQTTWDWLITVSTWVPVRRFPIYLSVWWSSGLTHCNRRPMVGLTPRTPHWRTSCNSQHTAPLTGAGTRPSGQTVQVLSGQQPGVRSSSSGQLFWNWNEELDMQLSLICI